MAAKGRVAAAGAPEVALEARRRGQYASCAERSVPARLPFCLFGSALAAAAAVQSDNDFLAARAAFERGDRGRLDALAPKLADHILFSYVEFWQRMLQLETATEAEIGAFFVRWPQSPLADRLRVDWLKVLGKQGRWSTFAAHYPPPAGEDVELACYGIQHRRQRDGDSALAEAKPTLVHGPVDAGILRAAVRGADREG